jgi:type I restriction enzyme S subunit
MTEDKDFKEPEGLPEGWKRVRLGGVCKITTGKKDVNEGNPEGEYYFFTCSRIPTRSDNYSFDTEAILIAGNGEVGTIHYYNGKFEAYQRTYVLVEFVSVDVKYIYYYLSKFLIKHFSIEKIGTTIQYIKFGDLDNFFIYLPEKEFEQRKIAEILETVDNAIEKTEKIIEKYKRIKQGLMQDLLTKGIDENGNIRSEKTHKFKDSPIGRIPEEWEVVRLGEVVERIRNGFVYHFSLMGKEGIPVTRIETISEGYIDENKVGYLDFSHYELVKTFKLQIGDILLSHINSFEHIGKTAIYNGKPPFLIHGMNLLLLRAKSNICHPFFLIFLLKNEEIRKKIRNLSGQAVNQVSINIFDLSKLSIPLPPLSEQQRIAEILSQIDQTIEKEQQYKEKLERLKQGLMQDLLTRKVRVNHLIEEGAENVST